MINKIELSNGDYKIVVENNPDEKTSLMGVNGWELMFTKKQTVLDHIDLLTKALEFWEYDEAPDSKAKPNLHTGNQR